MEYLDRRRHAATNEVREFTLEENRLFCKEFTEIQARYDMKDLDSLRRLDDELIALYKRRRVVCCGATFKVLKEGIKW